MAKQVIVMRSDLKNKDGHRLPKGKLIAQGAHASTGALHEPLPPTLLLEAGVSCFQND